MRETELAWSLPPLLLVLLFCGLIMVVPVLLARLGRLEGGGIRRAATTLPRVCRPLGICLITAKRNRMVLNKINDEYNSSSTV